LEGCFGSVDTVWTLDDSAAVDSTVIVVFVGTVVGFAVGVRHSWICLRFRLGLMLQIQRLERERRLDSTRHLVGPTPIRIAHTFCCFDTRVPHSCRFGHDNETVVGGIGIGFGME